MSLYDFSCNPGVAWLNVNQACNMRCKWCYCAQSGYIPTKEMSLTLAKELVDISVNIGISHFNIIGGEPTLWPHLFQLISYMRDKGKTIGLITNATRFGDDLFWSKYINCPADRISVSVKSASAVEYKQVVGSNDFSKTMLGIKRAISFHEVGITTVFNSLVGLEGLKKIGKACREMNANSIIVNMCSPVLNKEGTGDAGFSIPIEELANSTISALEYLLPLYEGNVEFDIQMPLCLFPKDFVIKYGMENRKLMTLCHVFSRSGINYDIEGNVTVCNEFTSTIAKRGVDFSDGQSLIRHLNTVQVKDYYSEILRYPSVECDLCDWKGECRGGCLMNWLIYEPSICHPITL